ncbi:MAG: TIGR04283 family arsenosugar biosynthesis glycosyltransferase [Chthoniobacterales bacterium]
MRAPSLSVIVPVLNESELVSPFLEHVRTIAPQAELIVVDGGSSDGTPDLAAGFCDRLLRTQRGRAKQMNAGAASALGEVFWFLHVDSQLPRDAIEAIERCLTNPEIAGGCFRLEMPRRELTYRVTDALGNFGVDLFRIALGDHGIFCRRSAFDKIGGYPDVPILEDAELYRNLGKVGDVKQLKPAIRTSARSFERVGRYRTTTTYAAILALYVVGVPIPLLHKVYLRLHRRG